MTDEEAAPKLRTWDRDRLLGIGRIMSTIGLATTLIGLAFPHPSALMTGQTFAAFGLGLIAASVARTLWRRSHERTDPFIQVGTFVAVAVAVSLLLAKIADLVVA